MRPNRLNSASFDLSTTSTEATPAAQTGPCEAIREIGTQCDAWSDEQNYFTYSPLYKLALGGEAGRERDSPGGPNSKPRSVRLVHKRASTAYRPELRSPLTVLLSTKSPCDGRQACPLSSFNPIQFHQKPAKKSSFRGIRRRVNFDTQQRTSTMELQRTPSAYCKKKVVYRKSSPAAEVHREDVVQSFLRNQRAFLHVEGQKRKIESGISLSRLYRSRTPFLSTHSLKLDL